jgi:hypothetical protein
VALEEDSRHYAQPPTFHAAKLAADLGLSLRQLARARGKAVGAGLLHYEPAARSRPGVYWVIVSPPILCQAGRESGEKRWRIGRESGAPTVMNLPSPVPIPGELDSAEFRAAWDQWQQHRRELKKPLTQTATQKQLAKLARMGERRAIAALEHSAANGWQGIFEPKPEHGRGLFDQAGEALDQFLRNGATHDPT